MAIRRLEKVTSSDGEQTHVCVCALEWGGLRAHVLVGGYVGIFHVNHTSGKL